MVPPRSELVVIREELTRLATVEERHRRLFARLLLAFVTSVVIFAAGTVLIWLLESGHRGGDIHGFGDAAFFTGVQLLTVSSQIKNPLTSGAGSWTSLSKSGRSSSSPPSPAASPPSSTPATRREPRTPVAADGDQPG